MKLKINYSSDLIFLSLFFIMHLNGIAANLGGIAVEEDSQNPIPYLECKLYSIRGEIITYKTLSDGTFELHGLLSGEYFISCNGAVNPPDSVTGTQDNYRILYAPFESSHFYITRDIDNYKIEMNKGNVIKGKVLQSWDQKPIPHIDLQIGTKSGRMLNIHQTWSNPDGSYEFSGLDEKEYIIYISGRMNCHSAPAYIPQYYQGAANKENATKIQADSVVSDVNIQMDGYIASGYVIDGNTDEPIKNAVINLLHKSEKIVTSLHGIECIAITDTNGYYILGAPEPGAYYIKANGSVLQGDSHVNVYIGKVYPNTPPESGCLQTLDFTVGEISDINFEMGYGSVLSGQVLNRATGEPVANCPVEYSEINGCFGSFGDKTDASGNFVIKNIGPGEYYLLAANTPECEYKVRCYPDADRESEGTVIELLNDKTIKDILLKVSPDISITGKVIDKETNDILPGLELEVYDRQWQLQQSGETDSEGWFCLTDIPNDECTIKTSGWAIVEGVRQQVCHEMYYPGIFDKNESEFVCPDCQDDMLFHVKDIDSQVDKKESIKKITTFALYPATPNPFNISTTISYDIPEDSYISLNIFDIRGSLVQTLFEGDQKMGRYKVRVNGVNWPTGVYFCKMQAGNFIKVSKFQLIK